MYIHLLHMCICVYMWVQCVHVSVFAYCIANKSQQFDWFENCTYFSFFITTAKIF